VLETARPEIPSPAFDAMTLAAILADVRAAVGARFAGVHQLSADAIVLSFRDDRRVYHLLYSIHPQLARVHFTARPEATERLGPFGQLLRSRLIDAHIAGVEQPAFDRILRLRLDALEGPLVLIAEVMGRRSNLILADERIVIGALKVVTARMSPRRPVLPGRPYAAPPADRGSLEDIDPAGFQAVLSGDTPLAQQLARGVLGLGPILAREIALRAGIDPELPAGAAAAWWSRLWDALGELRATWRAHNFAPTEYQRDGAVVAFSPTPLRVYDHLRAVPVSSMSEAVDRYYQGRGDARGFEERRRALASAVRGVLRQREAALEANLTALAESRSADRFRILGELLLTYGSRASPRQTALTVPDHTEGGRETTIPLDPDLTPSENAQRLFRKYAKAQATSRALPGRIAVLRSEAQVLREALVQIESAGSADDVWEIHQDLAEQKILRRPPRSRPTAPTGPRRFPAPGGAVILVGRSARENDHLTFHLAGPDTLWFHARGIPGAHVILKSDADASEAGITAAAQVAAFYSEGRGAGLVAVDYVPRRHVRKLRGAAPGAVVYEKERTIRVAPQLPASLAEVSRRGRLR
jgi:predicted ribosome quality control (RQC) complex YloA/Tae2 family protein